MKGTFAPPLRWKRLWKEDLIAATESALPSSVTQGLKLCFLTQSVQLTLSSVQLTLLECVMWSSKMSWNRGEKMNRFALTPILGRGYGAPPQTSPPSALRRFAPPCLARGLRPLHRPSLCVVDILRYFRPWCYIVAMGLSCLVFEI